MSWSKQQTIPQMSCLAAPVREGPYPEFQRRTAP